MQAVWYEQLGPADQVLQYGELLTPQPAAGEVRIAVHCSGVNPIDVKRRLGGRGTMESERIIPHFDGAGIVDAVGGGVPAERVGERVWFYEAQWQRDFGSAAEFVTLPSRLAIPLPVSASLAEGAALGIPALTAYGAVYYDGPVAGKTVVVTGGAGDVGRYAVQFAKLGGATVLSTVSSEEKAALATSAGADHAINYRTENVVERVLEITGGRKLQRIVEVEFGGNLPTSKQILATGGTIASYASQAVPEPTLPFYELMYQSIVLRHVLVFQLPRELKEQAIKKISDWLAEGKLSHHLGPRFPLAETTGAHQTVEQGALGKVIVEVQ